jgi:hypothetical protein
LIAGDLARRAPNAVTLSFIDGLNTDEKARFNDWYHSGDTDDLALWQAHILDSDAMKAASNRMFATLDRAGIMPVICQPKFPRWFTPVHGLIMRACSTASKNGAA